MTIQTRRSFETSATFTSRHCVTSQKTWIFNFQTSRTLLFCCETPKMRCSLESKVPRTPVIFFLLSNVQVAYFFIRSVQKAGWFGIVANFQEWRFRDWSMCGAVFWYRSEQPRIAHCAHTVTQSRSPLSVILHRVVEEAHGFLTTQSDSDLSQVRSLCTLR